MTFKIIGMDVIFLRRKHKKFYQFKSLEKMKICGDQKSKNY